MPLRLLRRYFCLKIVSFYDSQAERGCSLFQAQKVQDKTEHLSNETSWREDIVYAICITPCMSLYRNSGVLFLYWRITNKNEFQKRRGCNGVSTKKCYIAVPENKWNGIYEFYANLFRQHQFHNIWRVSEEGFDRNLALSGRTKFRVVYCAIRSIITFDLHFV